MADNFGVKLGLEGEKEFKKALTDINSSFKVLGSEMTLVTSQFDKNDKSVASLTAKNSVLTKVPSATFRLYWSAVPGDGRTIEDWLSVDGSEDASGGYVEVGDGSADPIIGLTALSNQLLIWKR